jgi:tetratricopeptide (TPR) repeat protein
MLGDLERAIRGRDATLEIIDRVRHPYTTGRGLFWCSAISAVTRDWQAASKFAGRAIGAAEEHGFAMVGSVSHIINGAAQVALDPNAKATAEILDGLDAYRRTGARFQLPFLLTLFAEALLAMKDWQAGLREIEFASTLIEETGDFHVAAEIHRIRGRLLCGAGTGDAEPHYLSALEVARVQGARLFELRACRDLAELRRDQGRMREARDPLAATYGSFTEGFDTPDLIEAKLLLDALSDDGDRDRE